jgi:hypothetical protein
MTFAGHLADAEAQIQAAGFVTTMWTPDFEKVDDVYPAQMLAAYQCFQYFFTGMGEKRAWTHLAAEMQAGKTGAVTALIRLVLANARKLAITPERVFVITGMGDNAWKLQTRDRLPRILRENVHHNSGLEKVQAALGRLAAPTGTLSNVLIIIDESHIASATSNRPNTLVYQTVQRLCPKSAWAEQNIRFLTISATDPAKVLAMQGETEVRTGVVRLQTTPLYQSVQALNDAGRVGYVEDIGNCNEPTALKFIKDTIADMPPLYHIMRPSPRKYAEFVALLRTRFPEANVQEWNSGSSGRPVVVRDDTTVSSSMQDINELLHTAPERHTFVVLKNMFYAAKTLNDQHVGILYDRAGGKDDTNLQSLLGRACGYGKSTRAIVVTSQRTVANYIACWRELSSRRDFPPTVEDIPTEQLNRKMSGVTAVRTGETTTLLQTTTHATPLTSGGSGGAAGGAGSVAAAAPARREKANEDDFDAEWHEFATMEEAKTFAPRVGHKMTPDADGFYLTHVSGAAGSQRLKYAQLVRLRGGKKTANAAWKDMVVGNPQYRLYVAYRDETNPASAVFVVRRLTRLR